MGGNWPPGGGRGKRKREKTKEKCALERKKFGKNIEKKGRKSVNAKRIPLETKKTEKKVQDGKSADALRIFLSWRKRKKRQEITCQLEP